MAELELIWAIVVSIMLVILAIVLLRLQRKNKRHIQELVANHESIQKTTITLGRSTVRGELNQILGSYALLNQYDSIAFLTSVAKQFPLDLIGLKEDSLDFIEIKSLKTPLRSDTEKLVKRLVDEKKVSYKIIEGNLPKSFEITERK